MEFVIDRRYLRRLFALLALINLVFIAGTWHFAGAYRRLRGDWDHAPALLKYVGVQFNLATENVVAAWYSSMLLLFVALAAGMCLIDALQRAQDRRERLLGYGWFMMCGIFLVLSLDEMGSIHERLGMLAALNPFGDQPGGWVLVLAIPIAVVALFILAFGVLVLYRQPWALALVVIGLAFFLIDPLLEQFEMALIERGLGMGRWIVHDILVVVEEGMEIFAALSFLGATTLYLLARLDRDTDASQDGSREILRVSRSGVFGVTLFIGVAWGIGMIVAVLVTPYLGAGDTGIPENWFPSSMAMLTALLAFVLARRFAPASAARRAFDATGLLCLLLSAYVGANLYAYLPDLRTDHPVGTDVTALAVGLAVVLAGVATARFSRGVATASVMVLACGALGSIFLWDTYTGTVVLAACALLGLALGIELAARRRNAKDVPTSP